MPYSLTITAAAEDDIREAFLWYEGQKDNLGSLFADDVHKAVDSLQSNPLKTQVRYGNTRIFFLQKFPYGIHFQVNEEQNAILIIAVLHTAQSPQKWKARK